MIIVMTTVSTASEGETLAEALVNAKLAACVQILPPMTSVYVWEGKLQKESEHLLLIKTLPGKYDALRELIVANHSYAIPEIVAIEADKVSGRYLSWINETIG